MHPKQAALLEQNRILSFKVSAEDAKPGPLLLWKYTDDEGKIFYLKEKKTTVKSPYSGKSFSAKPTKFTPSAVGKDMKEDAKKDPKSGPALLWKYTDDEANIFYLDEKKTTVKSPYSGKSFSAKPEKLTPSAIGKDMKTASMWKVDASVEKTSAFNGFNYVVGEYFEKVAKYVAKHLDVVCVKNNVEIVMTPVTFYSGDVGFSINGMWTDRSNNFLLTFMADNLTTAKMTIQDETFRRTVNLALNSSVEDIARLAEKQLLYLL